MDNAVRLEFAFIVARVEIVNNNPCVQKRHKGFSFTGRPLVLRADQRLVRKNQNSHQQMREL